MKRMLPLRIFVLSAAIASGSICDLAMAQAPVQPLSQPNAGDATAANPDIGSAILEWVPPALTQLSTQALAKESFTLDRNMLAAAAGLFPDADADVKQSVAKVDGVSVHI